MKMADRRPAADARPAHPNTAGEASGGRGRRGPGLGAGLALELELLGTSVRTPIFWVLVVLLLVLYTLALQRPVWLDLDVGAGVAAQPEQPNSFVHLVGRAFDEPVGRPYDQVFVHGAYPAEQGGRFTFRWTEPQAALVFYGLPDAPAVVRLRMHGATTGPVSLAALKISGRTLASFPVVYPLHHYAFVVDPYLWDGDTLRIVLESTPFVPGGEDSRSLGVAIDRVSLTNRGWDRWPAVPWTALFLTGTVVLLYLGLRRAGAASPAQEGCSDRWPLVAGVAAGLWGGLLFVALLLPARLFLAAYAGGLFLALVVAYPVLVGTLAAARVLFRRAGMVLDRRTWTWLAVLFLAAFLLRFGGALSPRYASHDGPFHTNRLRFAEEGELFFEHRSIEAGMRSDPYPSGLYLTLLPLTLFVDEPDVLLAFALAWLAGVEVFLFWLLARQVLGVQASRWAAMLYVAFPIALSAFWFGIYANLFANGVVLFLAVALVLAWQGRVSTRLLPWVPLWALFFLAHFGIVILWAPLFLIWGSLLYGAGDPAQRQRVRRIALSGVVALLLTVVLYYSHFFQFFGDLGVAAAAIFTPAQEPFQMEISWIRTLAEARVWWRWGLVADYAGIGIPLGFLGLGLFSRLGRRNPVALWTWAMVGVAIAFWLFSMVTAYFTRYMFFLLPVAALGSAQVLSAFGERGRIGRVVAVVLLVYVCVITVVLWLGLCLLGWHPPHVL